MAERRVTVASVVGLHARPAARLAKAAAAAKPLTVTIRKGDGPEVAAASVLGLMTLGAMHGDEVVLAAEGEGAEAVLDDLAALVAAQADHE
ncbi:HPr family phosphocarrier protein [Actinoalloteichus hymeniacidonis]|uniref:Phosphocarrier protein HPr n=1 Tax=Actinoalloteichus hymeniacidonis TaxID=340345 RepID=A0AAC9MYN6_9PSEU|nr:HPr family phosphocarrier protein [Actinoalloteichus hymeniacidonis]AOS63091.1 phosphotransferase system HPr (HPr) family protein [Actinoalloteichus hymeniacidonis]MBB5908873.1 phosphocarrier protein [Actinoalloteichus hymeniacidonis]